MNNFNPHFSPENEALLRYLPSDYQVIRPGKFVRCAVTNEPIPLEDLKYWNAERQEAYASPAISLKRHLDVTGRHR